MTVWPSVDFNHHLWIRANLGFYAHYDNSQTLVIMMPSALIRADWTPAAVCRLEVKSQTADFCFEGTSVLISMRSNSVYMTLKADNVYLTTFYT